MRELGLSARAPALPAAAVRAGAGVSPAAALLKGARLCLYGLIVLSPFRAKFLLVARPDGAVWRDYTDFLLYWSDVLLLAVLALWGASLLLERRRVRTGPALVRWPVAGLLAAIWLSVPFSLDPALSAYTALRLSALVALALFVANEVRTVRQIAPALFLMVVSQAAAGLWQVAEQGSAGLGALGELPLDPARAGASVVSAADTPRLLRAYGLTDHPNILGGLIAFALLLLAGTAVRLRSAWFWACAASFGLGGAALLVAFSRGAWLAMAAGIAVLLGLALYRRERSRMQAWLALCLAAAVVCAPLGAHYSRYVGIRLGIAGAAESATEEQSLTERETLASNAVEVFAGRPLLGVGAGALPGAMRDAFPQSNVEFQYAHAVLLDAFAEAGLPGGIAYAALLAAPWALLWRRRGRLTPELMAASAALAAVTVAGFFDYYTWTWAPGRIWAWLVLGLWAAAWERADAEDAVVSRSAGAGR